MLKIIEGIFGAIIYFFILALEAVSYFAIPAIVILLIMKLFS